MLAHLSGNVCEHECSVLKLDSEHGPREYFPDNSLCFDGFLFTHSLPTLSARERDCNTEKGVGWVCRCFLLRSIRPLGISNAQAAPQRSILALSTAANGGGQEDGPAKICQKKRNSEKGSLHMPLPISDDLAYSVLLPAGCQPFPHEEPSQFPTFLRKAATVLA